MTGIFKVKRLRTIFFVYWFLLAYIIAALIYWFIVLNQQNRQMINYKLQKIRSDQPGYSYQLSKIENEKKRKTVQYLGEGITFLLLIIAGAIFVFRVVRRQFRQSQQQQNFMMAITHELKTPIAVTKLNLETLQRHKLSEEQKLKLLSNTLQEANRLNDLCNNMLLASQIEAGGYKIIKEEVDLTNLIQECVHEFATRFPDRKLESNIQQDIYFAGDRLLFQMAVNNLLDNAIKYSQRNSKVWIELKAENEITISITDEGKGIADEEKEKVFYKFYRIGNMHTKGAKGTGLGLFLTKKIVEQHNGSIIVTANHPQGSIFVIRLKKI